MSGAEYPEMPWPKGGEVLFQSGKDYWNNAVVRARRATFSTIAEGMYLHAKLGVDHVNKIGSHQDYFVYPIAFCYRQFLELAMKDIIRNGRALLCEDGDYLKTHELGKLWNAVKPILMKVWPNGSKKDLDHVWKIIKQFHDVDPYSDAFRFPEGVDGKRPLANLDHVNLRNLGEVMERIFNFFDGCMAGISHYLDEMRDMERETREY